MNDNLIASELSDYSADRLISLRCLIGHFESYLEDMYGNYDYSFAEYLSDLDQNLLLSELQEIIKRKLCLSFSTSVKLQRESEVVTIATCKTFDDIHHV